MNITDSWKENDAHYCFHHLVSSCDKRIRSVVSSSLMYIFMMGCITVTVGGNLVVIISITHFHQLHTPTNFLILSLAVADCLLGLMVMPFSMIRSVETCWYFGNTFCKIHTSCDMMLCTCSILHLCIIAIDRYYAVCDPLHYVTKMTGQVTGVFLAIIWSVSLFLSFGLVFSEVNLEGIAEYVNSISCDGYCSLIQNKVWGIVAPTVAFFIPAFVMVGIYVKIFAIAERHVKVARIPDKVPTVSNSKLKKNNERKAAKTLGIVMGIFLFCWLPFFITTVVDPFLNFSTPSVLFDTALWLGYFNSTFNPIIYAFFYTWFREALKLMLSLRILSMRHAIFPLGKETI
ncbi:trace amine-associated receptor 4-like [Protopterus annectens]|uniref:trace amine-associated receptor 4-like n=1 Tax=Protopterus annectens TaxID=7888 RepID=UPI001CFBDD0B|nr:trace amine-associated receptor 4-like [Protopterus annectens]